MHRIVNRAHFLRSCYSVRWSQKVEWSCSVCFLVPKWVWENWFVRKIIWLRSGNIVVCYVLCVVIHLGDIEVTRFYVILKVYLQVTSLACTLLVDLLFRYLWRQPTAITLGGQLAASSLFRSLIWTSPVLMSFFFIW